MDTLHRRAAVAAVLLSVWFALPADATDGVLEINQACADAGCFAGDAAGLPVTITGSAGRSFRLTGDLTTLAFNVTMLEITGDHVTLDLNGFSIRCVALLGGECTGTGVGIDASTATNVTVKNGTVDGMGSDGLRLGPSARVEGVRAISNGGNGIQTTGAATVTGNTVYQNTFEGIRVGNGSMVQGNTCYGNGDDGIAAGNGITIQGNTSYDNGGFGIISGTAATVQGNLAYSNGADGFFANAASTVSGNTAFENGGDGIQAANGALVQGNTARSNSGFGLNLFESAYRENALRSNASGDVAGGINLGSNSCGGAASCP